MLNLKFSQILLLLIFNVSIHRGEDGKETMDFVNENVIISLEDDGFIGLVLNETDEIEYRHNELDFEDYIRHSEMENIKNNSERMEAKIVGGQLANIQDYPHSIFLMAHCDATDRNDYWCCGGSILNQRIVLTAAHCVYGCTGRYKIDALAGSANYEQAKVLKQVRRLAYHAKYTDEDVFADIGLVYLNGNLPLGSGIQRVMIRPYFPSNTDGRMAGWGVVDERGTPTNKLKVVRQKVWALSNCKKYETMVRGTFCASSGSKKHYAYRGDSGSALVVIPNYQELGLVSYRDDKYPELIVYTNVSYYYEWIKTISHKLYCNPEKL